MELLAIGVAAGIIFASLLISSVAKPPEPPNMKGKRKKK